MDLTKANMNQMMQMPTPGKHIDFAGNYCKTTEKELMQCISNYVVKGTLFNSINI